MQRMHGWIGRNDRRAVEIDAVAHRDDGSQARVRLVNVSSDGCRIEMDGLFRIGERFELSIPTKGKLQAQVRWALPGSAGARFLPDSDD